VLVTARRWTIGDHVRGGSSSLGAAILVATRLL
jgi:hypothetical protein